ncbi:MAG: alpha/beta hydrolase fold protein [Acidimicrobiaceae bacterium]|nr:alpha/beta hydrolase fold protein [Acidimicrobiaceae bacterium]
MHLEELGSGRPLLLLHQTPRSIDEYRELAPLLASSARVIAMDLPGMGNSAPPPSPATIEAYAVAALSVLDALEIDRADVMGHHTGGVVALELAAGAPGRVRRLVLSSTAWVDAEARRARRDRPPIDAVEIAQDGGHLLELWRRRQAFYPPERPDLLQRFVTDALRAHDLEAGHRAVAGYMMEERAGLVRADVLCIGHDADPYAFPDHERLLAHLPGAASGVVAGGMVPLEWRAREVADLLAPFLGAN